jgi:hypothetical protein
MHSVSHDVFDTTSQLDLGNSPVGAYRKVFNDKSEEKKMELRRINVVEQIKLRRIYENTGL